MIKKSTDMKRTLTTLIAVLLCIICASAQDITDQHTRQHTGEHARQHFGQDDRNNSGRQDSQHFGQHFGVHFGTSDRGHGPGHGRDRGRRPDVHMDTGIMFHRYPGGRMMLDVVHLKNGSEIVGVMTKMVPGESIRLVTYDGSTHVYGLDEVTMTSKRYGRWSREYRKAMLNDGNFNNDKGYFGIAELGVAALFTTENMRPSITVINGYRFYPQLAVGLGVGMNWYEGEGEFGIPVFLHVRSDFYNRSRSPFVALNIGGQFGIDDKDDDTHEGYIIEPSFGYGFNIGPDWSHQRMNISVGIAFDMHKEWYRQENRIINEPDCGISLKVGYSF